MTALREEADRYLAIRRGLGYKLKIEFLRQREQLPLSAIRRGTHMSLVVTTLTSSADRLPGRA